MILAQHTRQYNFKAQKQTHKGKNEISRVGNQSPQH
jgi:hypothetical protein